MSILGSGTGNNTLGGSDQLIFEYEGATSMGDSFGGSSSSLSKLERRLCSCVVGQEPFGGSELSGMFDSDEDEG